MDLLIGIAIVGVIGFFAWKKREQIRAFIEKLWRRSDDAE